MSNETVWCNGEECPAYAKLVEGIKERDASITALRAEREEALRRRDEWRKKADGFEEFRNAARAKIKSEQVTMSRVLLWAAVKDLELDNTALRAKLQEAAEVITTWIPVMEAHVGASHMMEGFKPQRNIFDDRLDAARAFLASLETEKAPPPGEGSGAT